MRPFRYSLQLLRYYVLCRSALDTRYRVRFNVVSRAVACKVFSFISSSSSSSYLFIYQVTSYYKKKLQLPLGLSPKHRNMQFL